MKIKTRIKYEEKYLPTPRCRKYRYRECELALDVVDKELLVDTLGIDPEICHKCRAIWKKMQTRRLGRGW